MFYSRYEYVLGYYGMEALANSLDAAGQTDQFGRPMAIFVTDLSETMIVKRARFRAQILHKAITTCIIPNQ